MIVVRTREFYTDELNAEREKEYANSIEGKLELASGSIRNGDFDTAMEYYDSILHIEPDNIKALFGRAKLFLKLKNYGNAIEDLDFILWIKPEYEEALELRESVKQQRSYNKKITAFPIYS